MAPQNPGAGRHLRVAPSLEPLVRQLAALSAAERREVIVAAEQTATERSVLSWDAWGRSRSVATLGGNAVDDCDRLYDGT